MRGISGKVLLWEHQNITKKGYPIKIRLIKNRQDKLANIGYYAFPEQWDFKNETVNKKHPDFYTIAPALMDIKKRIIEIENQSLELIEAYNFILKKKSISGSSFSQYARGYIELLKSVKRTGTAKAYETALTQFEYYMIRKDIKFSEVTYKNLNAFKLYKHGQGVSNSAIHNYLRSIRAIINQAIKEKHFSKEDYPFIQGLMPTLPRTPKRAIDIEIVFALANMLLTPGTWKYHARNLFVLQVYLGGLDLVDLIHLKKENIKDQSIRFYRHKLSGSGFQIENYIIPEAKHILNEYSMKSTGKRIFEMFPESSNVELYSQFRKNINKNLKRLVAELDFDVNITSKVARHTFATEARRKGINPELIAEMMGHEIPGFEVANIYKDRYSMHEKIQAKKIIFNI